MNLARGGAEAVVEFDILFVLVDEANSGENDDDTGDGNKNGGGNVNDNGDAAEEVEDFW